MQTALEVRQDALCRAGDAKPCDIVETLLYRMPTGNFYTVTSYQDLRGYKVRAHDVCGNIKYLHPDTAVRWCGDSRCISIKTIAFGD